MTFLLKRRSLGFTTLALTKANCIQQRVLAEWMNRMLEGIRGIRVA
jgi:hypothetical protein